MRLLKSASASSPASDAAPRCDAETYDRATSSRTRCSLARGHGGDHGDGALAWPPDASDAASDEELVRDHANAVEGEANAYERGYRHLGQSADAARAALLSRMEGLRREAQKATLDHLTAYSQVCEQLAAVRALAEEAEELLRECAPLTDHAYLDRGGCHETCLRCAVDKCAAALRKRIDKALAARKAQP